MFNSVFIFLILFSVAGVAFYMLIAYVLPWVHRKKVASYEMPEAWERVLNTKHPEFLKLDDSKKEVIRKMVKVFMAEKYFEPDNLKWDEQIMICATLALSSYDKKHRYLSKLSTIKIGKNVKEAQAFVEVKAIEDLKSIELKRWF